MYLSVFVTRRMVGGGHLLPEILGQADPLGNADIESIIARIASAVTPSKKFN